MTNEERLQRLESSNRLMKIGLAVCLFIGVVVFTAGAFPAEQKVLDVQKIVLHDEAGNERGQLFATDKAWGLVLFNNDGSKGVSLFVAPTQANGFFLADRNGNLRQTVTANLTETNWSILRPGSAKAQFEIADNAQGTGVVIRDRANMPRVELGASEKGPMVMLSDNNATARTVLMEGGDGIMTFTNEGDVQWSPTWDKLTPKERSNSRDCCRNSSGRTSK